MSCAWGGFAGYGVAMLLSYFVGQKYYPIDYPLTDMLLSTVLAGVLFVGITWVNAHLGFWLALVVNTVLVLVFLAYIIRKDLPLSEISVIGKYFRK